MGTSCARISVLISRRSTATWVDKVRGELPDILGCKGTTSPAFAGLVYSRRKSGGGARRFHPLKRGFSHSMQSGQTRGRRYLVDLKVLQVGQPVADRLERGVRLGQHRK